MSTLRVRSVIPFALGCVLIAAIGGNRARAQEPQHAPAAAAHAHAPAAEEEPGEGKGVPLNFKEDLALWSLVVFLIFVGLLGRFAWKPLISALDKRESRIRDDIAAFNRHLAAESGAEGVAILVKIGLHSGACIAVTLNDRLDYFGSAVNLAARLQSESAGSDIVLSETMAGEPGIAERLTALGAKAETARVKGFAEPVALRRIPAAD